jgi:hypothetical protein
MQVHGKSWPVADQPRAAVGVDQQRVGELGLGRHGACREDLAQPGRPGPQGRGVARCRRGLVHVMARQHAGEGRGRGRGLVDEPHGHVRTRCRVSIELHKTITTQ